MDGERFDNLTRTFKTTSRRGVLHALAGTAGALASALLAPGGTAARCPRARRCGRNTCCRRGEVCGDRDNRRCAPRCNDACFGRVGCGCASFFDKDRDLCNVQPADFGALCAQPACTSHEECGPDGFCANACCPGATTRRLAACPAE